MKKSNQQENLDFPLYDPNPRTVLESYNKEVKEKPIETGPHQAGQIEASPLMLSLTIILAANTHLNLLMDSASKIDLEINKKQKIKLYLELLSLYYFLIGTQIEKYLEDDQFTLFILKLHVELSDELPKISDTLWLFGVNPLTRRKKIKELVGEDSWKTGLSSYIHDGERFYIKNKLSEQEVNEIEKLKLILLDANRQPDRLIDYEKNFILQIMIKSYYRISKILNLFLSKNKDLGTIVLLYSANSNLIIENRKQVIRHIKPVWHSKNADILK